MAPWACLIVLVLIVGPKLSNSLAGNPPIPFCRPGFEDADPLNVSAWKRKFCRSPKASSDGMDAFPAKEFDNENDDEDEDD